MALGDGVTWAESLPDNSTLAHQIDDYDRDLRVGVRSRMAREHIWTSSQTATNEGGHHNFVTLQMQTAAPTLSGTSGGALWIGTNKAFYFTNSTGTDIMLVNTAFSVAALPSGGTQGSIPICSSANANSLITLAGATDGGVLHTHSSTAAPNYLPIDLAGTATRLTGFLSNANGGLGASTAVKWVKFLANGTIEASAGVTSVTRNSTGNYTIAWSANFNSAHYAISADVLSGSSNDAGCLVQTQAAGNCVVQTTNPTSAGSNEFTSIYVIAIGVPA